VDVDNGPAWTVTPDNDELYGDNGTELLAAALRPGGVLSVWSAQGSPDYEPRLRRLVGDVQALTVDVERGDPDVIYLARRSA
jgi:hypothetical protein